MPEKDVVIMMDGQSVSVKDVAERLGISAPMLEEAVRSAGLGKRVGVEAFYEEWMQGLLPIEVMPCRSTSLYRLYAWWCKQKGAKVLSEVMLMRKLPEGLSKCRRWVKVGAGMKTLTMIEPDSWEPNLEATLADELAEWEAEFSRQLSDLKG